MTTETPELALEELARRIDADGTASQIGSADEVREIAAMVARRAAATAEPAVEVKALIWHMSNAAEHWIAHHPFGEYTIIRDHRSSSETTHGWFSQGRWIWVGSLDEAKVAVQSDYEARIRSALAAPPPSPVVSEAMVQALQVTIHTLTAIRELCDKNRIDAMLNKVSAAGVDVAIIRARAALTAALSPAPAAKD